MTTPFEELCVGDTIYFQSSTGTVFKGDIIEDDEEKKRVEVDIDNETGVNDEGFPEHIAPKKYQKSSNQWLFRDAYTLSQDVKTYTVEKEDVIESV